MDQKALRLGNLVNDHLGRTLQVTGLKDDNVYLALSNGDKVRYNIKTIQPIFITEEWLFKFGFTYNGWNYDLGRFTFHAQGRDEDGSFYNTEFYILSKQIKTLISFRVQYVHQLQNICFALTERELTIKD